MKHSRNGDELQVDSQECESPSQAIVVAIAALENSSVTELPPLYDSIDPEALDQLLSHAHRKGRQLTVEVTIETYTVRAHADGTVHVVDIPSSCSQ